MSGADNQPGISSQEASDGASLAPVESTLTSTPPAPSEGGGEQTSKATSRSIDPNLISISPTVNPPVNAASNATGTAGSSQTLRQPPLIGGNGNRTNQAQLDMDELEKEIPHTGTYTGALIMTAVAVPIVASLISAVAFVAQWPTGIGLPDWLRPIIGTPLLLGTVSTLIAWLVLGFFIRRFTAADRMNMVSYGQFLNRLSTLDAQLSVLYPAPATIPPSVAMASKEVLDCRDAICKKLVKKSLKWVTATGYINLWQEMQNAEEALIDMMPREDVIAEALYDESRIQDSKIDTSNDLLQKLRVAVSVLDPSSKAYLQFPPSYPQGFIAPNNVPPSTGMALIPEEMQPRSVLREVRHALNEFRNDRWEAIVRVRNQFVCTTILTGFTLYVLLQFAILAGVTRQAIIAATAFYLVGALVGMFSRLYNESQTSKSIDDYRLSLARLVATPLYCGLAAVGGVLVTQQVTSLAALFDPTKLLPGLIVAAGFGLTPSLLMSTLQKQTETFKNDLKSTNATQGLGLKTP
jgi:hypothetical protein